MALKNNIKGSVKAFICGALIANLSVGAMISANAGSSSQGASLKFSQSGYDYSACNVISTGSDSQGKFATASKICNIVKGSPVQAGQMGANASIYDRNGHYISSSGMRYNSAKLHQ